MINVVCVCLGGRWVRCGTKDKCCVCVCVCWGWGVDVAQRITVVADYKCCVCVLGGGVDVAEDKCCGR